MDPGSLIHSFGGRFAYSGAGWSFDRLSGATHWTAPELLNDFGAIPVKARVVEDRNRFTGGGITADIDFGLALLAKLRGAEAAKLAQLIMEYNPAPPFNAGSPEAAGPELNGLVAAQAKPGNDEMRRLIAARKKVY